MEEKNQTKGQVTRREFLGNAAAVAAYAMAPRPILGAPAFIQNVDKPNSNFNGVTIGAITY
ncbi:twin-arginine translocation signal domain-containing protein, partial [bacterium]|nr:twin-arginine translocation signal domain-containing protein [bacterium]